MLLPPGTIHAGYALVSISVCLLAIALSSLVVARRKLKAAMAVAEKAGKSDVPHGDGRVLRNSSGARSTLMKLATYRDPGALREIAVRETGQMLGANAVYLFRDGSDGTTDLVECWLKPDDACRLPDDVANESETPDFLDSHAYISYRRNQSENGNEKWNALLARASADSVLAGPIRIDGEVRGHVSYLFPKGANAALDDLERFHEACAIVQTGVARAEASECGEAQRRKLAAAAREIARAARSKTLFLATMSHEIRTPLNALVGFSEFLNDPGVTEDEIREYTAGIVQQSGELLSLVNDVLDLSKLETGKVNMSGRCDLAALFGELASVFRYRARSKSVSIESHIGKAFPIIGLSEDHMRQIMLNLVGNAIKFTENGTVSWSAECRPDGNGTVALHITVKDTGCGIQPDRLQSIFDPFEGACETRGAKGATGLGLPIVKRLLDSCDGTISIDSAPGKGTEVYVRIGRVPVVTEAIGETAPAAPLRIPEGFQVLIVDDVQVNLKVLALRVKKMGVSGITLANSGAEALSTLQKTRPDVILTDMWMPGMTGSELAAAVRKIENCADVPIIAVTADNDAKASFDMSNFTGVVTKPVSVDKLSALLGKAVRGRRAA